MVMKRKQVRLRFGLVQFKALLDIFFALSLCVLASWRGISSIFCFVSQRCRVWAETPREARGKKNIRIAMPKSRVAAPCNVLESEREREREGATERAGGKKTNNLG